MATTKTTNTAPVLCLCNCGDIARKHFRQGHDAKLKGVVLRAIEQGETLSKVLDKAQLAYLQAGGFSGRFVAAVAPKAPRAPRKVKETPAIA